jgi:choline dehydrogenase-like flavoprotein
MQKYVSDEFLPGPSAESDEDWVDHIRHTAGTTYHATSTCMMGSHEKAVVDTALRVHGVEALRVIDASIMPTVVSGNTNAAAIMIAEKGADMILSEARSNGTIVTARAARGAHDLQRSAALLGWCHSGARTNTVAVFTGGWT